MPTTQKRIAIVGCGYTKATRRLEKDETDLARDACVMAAEDAGMDPADIDGINVQVHHYPPPDTGTIVKKIGMREVNWSREGGLGIGPAGIAAQAIDSGECKAVLITKIMNTVAPVSTPQIDPESGGVGGAPQFEVPFGLGYSMQRIGLTARRYMNRYGITEQQLAQVAIVQREHAQKNPWAFMQADMSMEDYLNARFISEPIRLFDCDIPVNGAFAFLMTTEEIAKTLKHAPVYLRGWSQSKITGVQDHMLEEQTSGLHPLAEVLYKDTGLSPEQMDLWFLYDGFLHFVPMWMENLGLVPRGEAGNYLEGGDNIRLSTGEHPLNTHGGQLSEGRLHGQGHVLEAVQQLRGTAGPRQTKTKASYAIISSVFPATGAAGILSLE